MYVRIYLKMGQVQVAAAAAFIFVLIDALIITLVISGCV